jgi:hypothetical protein
MEWVRVRRAAEELVRARMRVRAGRVPKRRKRKW